MGKIRNIEKEKLQKIVSKANSISDILRMLDLSLASNNYLTLKRRVEQDNIDISHIKLGKASNKGRKFGHFPRIATEDILIEHSTYSNGTALKARLIHEQLLKEECYECGQLNIWNNKKLILQLDHINGIHDDNRIENLRFLCPNCHSQTETFAGKSLKKNKIKKVVARKRKVDYNKVYNKYTECKNYSEVGRLFSISEAAVRKIIKNTRVSSNWQDSSLVR